MCCGREVHAQFHWHVEGFGIRRANLKPALTQLNGKVERPHRTTSVLVAKYEGVERRIDVVEFVAIVRAIGIDPVKLLRDPINGRTPVRPRRAMSK
jgi:hypothetical protein